ncbi:unnamed protein product [Pedinophyceae sp. YPF-701]|nr:unnamed protein product [Pedinophyceae sp. YPF-701]
MQYLASMFGGVKVEDSAESSPAAGPSNAGVTRLFRFAKGQWKLEEENPEVSFYNECEEQDLEGFDHFVDIGKEIRQRIIPDMDMQFNTPDLECTFRAEGQGVYCLRFAAREQYDRFANEFENRMFENQNNTEFTQEALVAAFGGEKNAGLALAWGRAEDPADMAMDIDGDPEEEESAKASHRLDKEPADGTYSLMEVGAGERSYAVRGGVVDVFKNHHGGVEAADVAINLTPVRAGQRGGGVVATPEFHTPSRAMLVQNEQGMLMLTPGAADRPSAMKLDLERETVVGRYGFQQNGVSLGIKEIQHEHKAAGLEGTPTFLALNANGKQISRFDMRAGNTPVQDVAGADGFMGWTGGTSYKSNMKFNAVATTGAGELVTGSDDGMIRLYRSKDSMSRAVTAYPGYGHPITAIDVTHDGKMIVATCDSYLILVFTAFRDASGAVLKAFTKSLNSKGAETFAPRMLKLKPQDAERLGPGEVFRNAKFNWVTESGVKERWIIAHVGKKSVMWSVARAASTKGRRGGGAILVTDYFIDEKAEDVRDARLMHDNHRNVNGDDAAVVLTDHFIWTCDDDDE